MPRFPFNSASFVFGSLVRHRDMPPLPSRESTGVLLTTNNKRTASNPEQATILSSSKEPETKCGEELVGHDLETVQRSGLGLWAQGRGSTPDPSLASDR